MRIDPGGGGSGIDSVPHDQRIDETKVTEAARVAQSGLPENQSNLASVLTNPRLNLNQAEKDKVIQEVAHADPLAFLANDAIRTQHGNPAELQSDQAVVGDAVQQAYADGAINQSDLMHIADLANVPGVNPSQDYSAQRFLNVLMQGDSASLHGSAAETLANALWDRNGNNGADRAAAATYYTSNSLTMQNDIGKGHPPIQVLRALVNFNQNSSNSSLYGSKLGSQLQNQAIAGEANLFMANSKELTKDLTLRTDTHTPDTQLLAKFMSQTVFNPSAQKIQLDDGSTLKSSMSRTLKDLSASLVHAAKAAKPGSLQQYHAIEEYGRLSAGLSGGAAVALTKYDAEVQANDASRQEFANLVGGVIGNVVPINTPVGNPAKDVAGDIAKSIYNALVSGPKRPTAEIADRLYNRYAQTVEQLRSQPGEPRDLTTDFDSTYSATLLQLQQELNVNLGGHAG